ncbi:MAG: DNA-processing protein DprA [Planctomycetota bacterium]|nr:DNA-processing protein DprA [Planctomycetota bacterium]
MNNDEVACLIALNAGYVQRTVCEELQRNYGDLVSAFEAVAKGSAKDINARLSAKMTPKKLDSARKELQQVERKQITLIPFWEPNYPRLLDSILNPPPLLYCLGNVEILDRNSIAMVGTRSCSMYGTRVATGLSKAVADAGYVVTSGLALGVDTASHEAALEVGGLTTAVLGSGLGRIYPARNRKLAKRIAEAGCLVSEFPLDAAPQRFHFPRRNRVISGLSLATVVVEAGRKSGALITATWAAEQGREVFAVPGQVDTGFSSGCHQLLREGARVTESLEDIEDEISRMKTLLARDMEPEPLPAEQSREKQHDRPMGSPRDARKKLLLDVLGNKGDSLDSIEARTGLTADITLPLLMEMELEGRVVKKAAATYAKV